MFLKFAANLLALGMSISVWAGQAVDVKHVDFDFDEISKAINVQVAIGRWQFNEIRNNGGKIEIRFYAAERTNPNLPRILKGKSYYLNSNSTSFTVPNREACPSSGSYRAKVWMSVRYGDGKMDQNFDPYDGSIISYNCVNPNADRVYSQQNFKLKGGNVNVKINMNQNQMGAIRNSGLRTMVEFQLNKGSGQRSLGAYELTSDQSSYTLNGQKVCANANEIWASGRETFSVTCKLYVLDNQNDKHPAYQTTRCGKIDLICPKSDN